MLIFRKAQNLLFKRKKNNRWFVSMASFDDTYKFAGSLITKVSRQQRAQTHCPDFIMNTFLPAQRTFLAYSPFSLHNPLKINVFRGRANKVHRISSCTQLQEYITYITYITYTTYSSEHSHLDALKSRWLNSRLSESSRIEREEKHRWVMLKI